MAGKRQEHVIVMAALAYVRCECRWKFRIKHLRCGRQWKTDEDLMLETMAAFQKHKKRKGGS